MDVDVGFGQGGGAGHLRDGHRRGSGVPARLCQPDDTPSRMFFQASPPPDHERYLEELLEILAADGPPDYPAIEELRRRYDIQQLAPLRSPDR